MFKGIRTLLRFDWQENRRFILYTFSASLMNATLPVLGALLPRYIYRFTVTTPLLDTLAFVLFGYLLLRLVLNVGSLALTKAAFVHRTGLAAKFSMMLHSDVCRAEYAQLESPDYLLSKEQAEKFVYADWHGFSYQVDQLFSMMGQLVSVLLVGAMLAHLQAWVLAAAVVLSLLNTLLIKRLKKQEAAHTLDAVRAERQWNYLSHLYDHLPFAKDIRLYDLKDWLLEKEAAFSQGVCRIYSKRAKAALKAEGVSHLSEGLILAVLLAYLLSRIQTARLNAGDLLTYFYAMHAFVGGMRAIAQNLASLVSYEVYHDSLQAYLDIARSSSAAAKASIGAPPYHFEFRHVSFRYPGQQVDALRDICCSFRMGEQIGIVGENGAGKTTFVNLLLGFYRPTQGQVLLNGVDVATLDGQGYRDLFTAVFQDYQLFEFSIRDNLTLGKDLHEQAMRQALDQLRLTSLVTRQSKGLDATIGRLFDHEGFIPSGGEGQRLALCRVFLQNRPVLVLDEPTSALDAKVEDALYKDVRLLAQEKLVLLITHRLASAKDCHRILVFHKGRLIETGPHSTLMASGGHYHQLYTVQASHYRSDQPAPSGAVGAG